MEKFPKKIWTPWKSHNFGGSSPPGMPPLSGVYKGVLEPGSIKLTTPNAVTRPSRLRFLRSSLVQYADSVFLSWVKQKFRFMNHVKDEDSTYHANENREIGSCLPAGLQWSYLTLDSTHRDVTFAASWAELSKTQRNQLFGSLWDVFGRNCVLWIIAIYISLYTLCL